MTDNAQTTNQNPPARRVVVTGLGLLTCLGHDVETTWSALLAGKSGIAPISSFDATGYPATFAGEVRGYDPVAAGYADAKESRNLDPSVTYALAVAQQAISDSGLQIDDANRDNIGVIFGSGMGGVTSVLNQEHTLLERGHRRVSPHLIPNMLVDSSSGYIAIKYGVRGTNMAIVSACATGGHNIGEASEIVRRGDVDVVITGSADSIILPLAVAAFGNMKALADNADPIAASRPFDRDRNGFVLAEGAACLVLEELEHARKRGARIYAEIIGYGSTNDAYHIASPDEAGGGAARCMAMAIRKGGIQPQAVDYINAHGTSTQMNDRTETLAIKEVFGDHARRLAVSSIKSMIGHAMGAAGSIEAVATILSLRDQMLPPTINYRTPDPVCDLDYVPNEARPAAVNIALSNSIGMGGHNSALIFRRYTA